MIKITLKNGEVIETIENIFDIANSISEKCYDGFKIIYIEIKGNDVETPIDYRLVRIDDIKSIEID